jgi:hypothetical protein
MASSKTQPTARSKPAGAETPVNLKQLKLIVEDLQRWLQESRQDEPAAEGRAAARAPARPAVAGVQIRIWEDDPILHAVGEGEPEEADPSTDDLPQNNHPLLQTQILQQQPAPDIYPPSSPEFLYWNTASALARGINFWAQVLPNGTQWTTDKQPLQVTLDAGEDFNAFYARDSGLNFFHGLVQRMTKVFSAESPDVVCHELGHAILDAVKPELFDVASMEVAAFHEAFGDISSMLSALQLASMRQFVLDQTGGRLNANSRLSQLARQLGWAIRVEISPAAVDADCLRNACNKFFYQDPAGLPPTAPATHLSSEPHSFSRVFSGAMLDVLARMFQIGPAAAAGTDTDKLEAVSVDAGRLVIEGVRLAPVGPGFYGQVAAGMVQADQSLNGGRYRTALTSSFVQRGILSPTSAVTLGRDLQAHVGRIFGVSGMVPGARNLQIEGDNEGYKKTAKDAPTLPVRPLTTRFGITLHVHMPAEPNRFGVASAALAGGFEKTFSAEEDARSFVEDLIQLDRISHENAKGIVPTELTAPDGMRASSKTHMLVQENGKTVLKRHHFTCGCHGCAHRS